MRTEYTIAGKHLRCALKTPLQTLVVGETVLKVKVPPVRIENSLPPLYRGTDFSALAETFQTVCVCGGGGGCLKSKSTPSED